MSSLIRAVSAPEAPRPSPAISASSASVGGSGGGGGGGGGGGVDGGGSSKTLKFVLSSLRARFKNSQGSLREIFREWDTDKSGSVDADEMRVALHGMGFTAVADADAKQLIDAIDLGGDGEVQFEDFVRLLCPPKGETHAVTCSAADVARINVPVAPSAVNLPGKVFMLAGRAVKRVLGPSEAASLRHTSVGDAGNGVGSDPLKESVLMGADAAEAAVRRVFSTGMGAARESSHTVAAAEEELGGGGAAAALAASAAGGPPPRPLAPLRGTARREETVELASLPPSEQHRFLTARGLLPPEPPRAARPDVAPSWLAAAVEAGPSMDELIQAAHATNRLGREFAEKVARGEATMEDAPGAGDGGGGGGYSHGFVGAAAGAELPPLPERVSVPVSPLHLTSRLSARRAAPVPLLALPGDARGALAPAATTDWAHPLSYMAQSARGGGEGAAGQPQAPLLRALVPAAVRPTPSESLLFSGRTLTTEGRGEGGDAMTQLVPPPASLDRSLHAAGRLPPRREGLLGPFSSTGSEPVAGGPEGGVGDTVVVGHVGGHSGRAITAVSRDALTPLDAGPFVTSAATRLVEGHVARLRLSARDVLALPLAGKPTAPHLAAAPEPPPSPLRAPGGGSPREARFEERRRAFIAARGGEGEGGGGGGGGVAFRDNASLSEVISGGKALRSSRFGSLLGGGGGGGGGGAPGASAPAPAPENFSPEAVAAHQVPGGSRLLAAAVREEGQRTTWLLSPPPAVRAEATPEHPSWHFASSARLAQTRTVVPEQEFARLARRDKHAGQRAVVLAVAEATAQKDAADWAFSRADVASRIARKREEREQYRAAVMHRKMGQESMLSLPFPVGEVQM